MVLPVWSYVYMYIIICCVYTQRGIGFQFISFILHQCLPDHSPISFLPFPLPPLLCSQVKRNRSIPSQPQQATHNSNTNNHCNKNTYPLDDPYDNMVGKPLNFEGRNRAPSPSFRQHYNHHYSTKRRRSSIAVMTSILDSNSHLMLHPESVSLNVKDPLLASVDRRRKTSWSLVVGISDSRSVGTGLNELDRITGTRVCLVDSACTFFV